MINNRRIQLLKHTLLQRRLGGSFSDWIHNTLGPTCSYNAKKIVKSIEILDEFYQVELKDVPGQLFVSKKITLHNIYQIIAEECFSWNWHQYQIPQTTISPDDYVFDCGCAEGLFTFLNHHRAQKFICFEPVSDFRRGLTKSFQDNPRIVIVPNALGDHPETVYFTEGADIGARVSQTPTGAKVDVTTIDLYCQSTGYPMNYLKADVEGHDLKLLKGAAETIRKYRPKIAITTYHVATHAAEMKAFLQKLIPGYHILTKGIEASDGSYVMLHAW